MDWILPKLRGGWTWDYNIHWDILGWIITSFHKKSGPRIELLCQLYLDKVLEIVNLPKDDFMIEMRTCSVSLFDFMYHVVRTVM